MNYVLRTGYPEVDVATFVSEVSFAIDDIIKLGDDYIVKCVTHDVMNHSVILWCENLTEIRKKEDEWYEVWRKKQQEKQNNRKWWQIF